MLVATLSVPDHAASWDAGMFTSCHLCPLILVAEHSRKAARPRGGPGPCPATPGGWAAAHAQGLGCSRPADICGVCMTPPPFLATLGSRVLLPAALELMWQFLVCTAVRASPHCDSCSVSTYLLSACHVPSRVL